jgi:hypothetical protein
MAMNPQALQKEGNLSGNKETVRFLKKKKKKRRKRRRRKKKKDCAP